MNLLPVSSSRLGFIRCRVQRVPRIQHVGLRVISIAAFTPHGYRHNPSYLNLASYFRYHTLRSNNSAARGYLKSR